MSRERIQPSSSTTLAGKNHSSNILVHIRQKNNPVLNFIKKVAYEFRDDLLADFVVGPSSCCLFLSLRYHQTQPQYIVKRLDDLHNYFTVRILLVQVDIKDPPPVLREINRMALQAQTTLIIGWTSQEIGQYLEHYKILENKPADLIKEKIAADPYTRAITALSSLKSINKPDAVDLLDNFGSLKKIAEATLQELAVIPGIGERKAKMLFDTFREPLIFDK
ncbi:DNA excision repair protein ERCC-1-like [Tropilaelaps mercedesae]|uniref:DNA excision repair protein ERCC-1-like n=1 Tax=Tropilaelaps mercedesae TaxID=418985 RepID=A0A1V9XRH4_9ACAR|nr:DNA excision repair protein ERCC-1-like [Tropilaelaps mercedesae]